MLRMLLLLQLIRPRDGVRTPRLSVHILLSSRSAVFPCIVFDDTIKHLCHLAMPLVAIHYARTERGIS